MIRGLESINEFVNVMLESKDKFETVKEEFDQKNLAITQCINRFQDKINRIKNSETAIDDEEIMELYTRAVGSLNELLNQVAEFVRIIQEEDNFPDQFFSMSVPL